MKQLDYATINVTEYKTYEQVNGIISQMLLIDESNIEWATTENNKIFGILGRLYDFHVSRLDSIMKEEKKVRLQRWKVITGKMPERYYNEKEPAYGREAIKAADVDKYLNADPEMQAIDELVTIQERIVKLIEDAKWTLSKRGGDIKLILEYRRQIGGYGV